MLPDQRGGAGTGPPHDPAAERPQREAGDSEAREPKGDRDDQDEGQDSEERVEERQPESGQHEPDDVEDQPHDASVSGSAEDGTLQRA
jgi:hypothetical protein